MVLIRFRLGFTTTDAKLVKQKILKQLQDRLNSIEVIKVTDGSLKALESKLDKIYSAVNSTKSEIKEKNQLN